MFPFWSKKKPKAITKERIIVGTQASQVYQLLTL
jgi:hypothetical protein